MNQPGILDEQNMDNRSGQHDEDDVVQDGEEEEQAEAGGEAQAGGLELGGSKKQPVCNRVGKWTTEEFEYMLGLMEAFKAGHLPLQDGTTLRSFLSKMMRCKPKRISKKFEGIRYNGRQTYQRSQTQISVAAAMALRARLGELERRYLEAAKREDAAAQAAAANTDNNTPGSPKKAKPTKKPTDASRKRSLEQQNAANKRPSNMMMGSMNFGNSSDIMASPSVGRDVMGAGSLGLMGEIVGAGGNLLSSPAQTPKSLSMVNAAKTHFQSAAASKAGDSIHTNTSGSNSMMFPQLPVQEQQQQQQQQGGNNSFSANSLSQQELAFRRSLEEQRRSLEEQQRRLEEQQQLFHRETLLRQQQQYQGVGQSHAGGGGGPNNNNGSGGPMDVSALASIQSLIDQYKQNREPTQANNSNSSQQQLLLQQLQQQNKQQQLAAREQLALTNVAAARAAAELQDATASSAQHNADLNRYVLQAAQDDTTYFQQRLLPHVNAGSGGGTGQGGSGGNGGGPMPPSSLQLLGMYGRDASNTGASAKLPGLLLAGNSAATATGRPSANLMQQYLRQSESGNAAGGQDGPQQWE